MKIFYRLKSIIVKISIIFLFIFITKNTYSNTEQMEPNLLYSNQNWHFLDYYNEDNKKVCYLFSRKIDSFTNDQQERDAHITLVFHKRFVQVSIHIGYDLRPGSCATVSLDSNIYIFKKHKNSAYLFLEKDYYDYKFLKDLKNAKSIYVFTESNHYTYAVDVYSFRGFNETFEKIKKHCGIKNEDFKSTK